MNQDAQGERDTQAIENFEDDEIQFVGSVQWYGWLLAADPRLENVAHVSTNITHHTGLAADAVLGAPLVDVLGWEIVHDLRNVIGHSTIDRQREHLGSVSIGTSAFDVTVHKAGGVGILEFIPTNDKDDVIASFSRAQTLLARLHQIDSVDELLEAAVAELRRFSGYDRVMTYRFLPDGSDEVIAEHRSPSVESLLGSRVPGADVPDSAQLWNGATPMRLLSDVVGEQASIASANDPSAELDLSMATLRGTVPSHTLNLQNMGVRATLSLPIVVDRKTWGLFAFHHLDPKWRHRKESRANMTYFVLIMEDDLDLAMQWQTALRGLDVEASLAGNRVEAEAFVGDKRFDAVVTDMFIDSGDGGLIFISHLRVPALAGTPEWGASIPILAVTATPKNEFADVLEYATYHGADSVMRKPFTPEALAKRVVALIEDAA